MDEAGLTAQGNAGHSVTQGKSWRGLLSDKETDLGNAGKADLSDTYIGDVEVPMPEAQSDVMD